MDTGIYYLYEYSNNQKLRNTGFLKITQQERTCFLQLNVCGLPVTPHDTVNLAVFYIENNSANAAHLSDIICGNHTISKKLTITETDFPNQYPLNRMDGFYLMLPHGEILAATAPNVEFDAGKIVFLSDKISITPPQEKVLSEEILPEEFSPEKPTSEITDASQPEGPLPKEVLSAKPEQTVRKIRRCELSCLPRRYWNLANNSFLLHGYYNYNHLLLVEEDGHYLLGVPGIYDPKESRAAELFGFTHFSDFYNQQLALTEEECNDFGRFGYWCRYLK